MDHCREKTSTLFTRLANGLGRKLSPTIVPLSKPLGSPAHQSSLIFELPDELILSVLSHISPDPQFTGHYARFRVQYCMDTNDHHKQRVRFLLPLSMTCRTMRSRLLPWIWERIESPGFGPGWKPQGGIPKGFNTLIGALRTDTILAANVKFLTAFIMWGDSAFAPFVRCLESLPNLHTLEIGQADDSITRPLKNALKHIKLPQVKALILPPAAHHLLRHCLNAEDVVYVIGEDRVPPQRFLKSLASNRCSKVKRLAIPLGSWSRPSRFVAACPRLTELTVLYPHPPVAAVTELGVPIDVAEATHSITSELVNACVVLPGFNTLQIVHFLLVTPTPVFGSAGAPHSSLPSTEPEWKQALMEQVKSVCPEGGGRKKTTLKVIELTPYPYHEGHHRGTFYYHLDRVKVEEYEL